MWALVSKESWVPKNWCFWTVLLQKTLEITMDCKEIQPVNPKWDQSWVFIGRADVETETPILWWPDAKSWLIWKDCDVGKVWGQEEKGTTEDEMVGWHHRLNRHGFGWTLAVVMDREAGVLRFLGSQSQTWLSDWTELNWFKYMVFPVVMYGYECWTIKKAECYRIDAFELWCWRKLLRVPWTARRSNQSVLKEISPECSLWGLMLNLKLECFGHMVQRTDSFDAGKDWSQEEKGMTEDDGWIASPTQWTWVWVTLGIGDGQGGLACGNPWGHKELDMTEWPNWTELNWTEDYNPGESFPGSSENSSKALRCLGQYTCDFGKQVHTIKQTFW